MENPDNYPLERSVPILHQYKHDFGISEDDSETYEWMLESPADPGQPACAILVRYLTQDKDNALRHERFIRHLTELEAACVAAYYVGRARCSK